MERLFENHNQLLRQLNPKFERALEKEIEWSEQLIGLQGARGVGKTTLLLQHIKNMQAPHTECLYVSMDDIIFNNTTLVDFAQLFYNRGGKYLFLDEIHKYESWSQELKNIYDRVQGLKVVFTGSSMLHIHRGKADLSRRAVVYHMNGLSFREFLQIETKLPFAKLTLNDIISNHVTIANEINQRTKPLAHFQNYLQVGYYPYFLQNKNTYPAKLMQTVNLSLEVDLPYVRSVEIKYVNKLKRLLYMIATNVPFQPNVAKLATTLEMSRPTVLQYLQHLHDAELINILHKKGNAYATLITPEKIYLNNTNINYSLAPQSADIGSMRETFFYNQLLRIHKVECPEQGDFWVDDKYTFEIGGKAKNNKQVKTVKHSYVVADDIAAGTGNKIPLWLFGFLY